MRLHVDCGNDLCVWHASILDRGVWSLGCEFGQQHCIRLMCARLLHSCLGHCSPAPTAAVASSTKEATSPI